MSKARSIVCAQRTEEEEGGSSLILASAKSVAAVEKLTGKRERIGKGPLRKQTVSWTSTGAWGCRKGQID